MWRGLRTQAIRRAEQWMLERTRYTDGVAAIYPPMMYVIMALDLLGYPKDHPDVKEAEQQFFNLLVDDERGFYFQPCFSVVWDTAIAAYALGESGVAPEQALTRAADWLLTKEVRRKGDWAIKRPNVEPSGWYFEFANEYYPDIDDTAQVLLALSQRAGVERPAGRLREARGQLAAGDAIERRRLGGVRRRQQLAVPERGAVRRSQRDARSDLSGYHRTRAGRADRVGRRARSSGDPARRRVSEAHRRKPTEAGTGAGASIISTARSWRCADLQAAGESDREAYILRAGEWLRSIQNADGGWGESCASYDQQHLRRGAEHAFADGMGDPRAARRRRHHQQQPAQGHRISDGDAAAPTAAGMRILSTGTGFPGVFYLKYHLYRNSFPVLALSSYLKSERARTRSRPIHESSAIAGRRHGDLHRQEQDPAAPGVAEESSARRTSGESVQDRSHPDSGGSRASASRIR